MGAGPITFNYEAWRTRYPEFKGISDALAQLYFNEATIYCDNTGAGPVQSDTVLATLLNMATAHIAALNSPQQNGVANSAGTDPASPLVGRISNATEGSVSVQTDMPDLPGSAAWWAQTKYGFAFWQATMQYRTMRWRTPRPRNFQPYPFGGRVTPWWST